MIYLCSPYSNPDIAIEHQRFEAVCMATAELIKKGFQIFSPISHSHPLVQFGLRKDWDYWKDYDRKMIRNCREVWVLMLDGWKESKGVTAEIEFAYHLKKPVRFIKPSELNKTETQ